jgi:hypothetical protein
VSILSGRPSYRHDERMDLTSVRALRDLLASTGWVESSRRFARSLRDSTSEPGGLLLVGTPQSEPWHLAAHLDDEARYGGRPELAPTLVRWNAPRDAPPHLRIGFERLEAARRGETLFVVAPEAAPERLLERLSDARRVGATVLSMDGGDAELADLAHDRLVVPTVRPSAPTDGTDLLARGTSPPVDMETVQHLVSLAAGEEPAARSRRDRLARLLERLSGPAPRG